MANVETNGNVFTSEMQFPFSCLITPPLRYVYQYKRHHYVTTILWFMWNILYNFSQCLKNKETTYALDTII